MSSTQMQAEVEQSSQLELRECDLYEFDFEHFDIIFYPPVLRLETSKSFHPICNKFPITEFDEPFELKWIEIGVFRLRFCE